MEKKNSVWANEMFQISFLLLPVGITMPNCIDVLRMDCVSNPGVWQGSGDINQKFRTAVRAVFTDV